MSLYRKLKDVRFALYNPDDAPLPSAFSNKEYYDPNLPVFRIYFKVQEMADVVAFEVNKFKKNIHQRASTFMCDKMAEFSRIKSREIDEANKLAKKRELDKSEALFLLDQFVQESQSTQQAYLNKFCLVLNEKKKKIKDLKSIIESQNNGTSLAEVLNQLKLQSPVNQNPPQNLIQERQQENQRVKKNTLSYLQSQQSQPSGPQTQSISSQLFQKYEQKYDDGSSSGNNDDDDMKSFEKQDSLTDLFFK